MINKKYKSQALVTLIVFVAVAMVIISSTVIMIGVNSLATSVSSRSLLVREAAENGMENALLRLLRDPDYVGETLPASINTYDTVITVTGDDIYKTVTSTVDTQGLSRKIQAKIDYTGNVMTIYFWQNIQ